MTTKSRTSYIVAYIIFLTAIVVGVYIASYRNGLQKLSLTGNVRIEQSRDRLVSQLAVYKQLSNNLAQHPVVRSAFSATSRKENINEFLLNSALISGAEKIFIVDNSRIPIATSSFESDNNFINQPLAKSTYINAALNGRLGFANTIGKDHSRKFIFARSVIENKTIGVVIIEIDIAALEFEWRIDEDVIAFFDENEVVMVTNRPALALRKLGAIKNNHLGIRPFFDHLETKVFGRLIWHFNENELPSETLLMERHIPQIDMVARAFLSTKKVKSTSWLQALLVASLLGIIGLGLLILSARRQRLADLLIIEEAAKTTLETQVEKRTKQLRNAQKQLIEAGKLTALGQMSAGISHELNQPLATMQNFAENGAKLIEMGRTEEATDNFLQIKGQVNRVSRIIQSLRAFARKEKETIEAIDLQLVISESLSLSSNRLKKEAVNVILQGIKQPIFVMGGYIRLQQVVINILTNALDAMSNQNDKDITIDILKIDDQVHLKIQDNGPGIKDATRIFEPFYTTKDVGTSKGLGLGLSISYGIIGSFGGDITCQNRPEGGAKFTIMLLSAQSENA